MGNIVSVRRRRRSHDTISVLTHVQTMGANLLPAIKAVPHRLILGGILHDPALGQSALETRMGEGTAGQAAGYAAPATTHDITSS